MKYSNTKLKIKDHDREIEFSSKTFEARFKTPVINIDIIKWIKNLLS